MKQQIKTFVEVESKEEVIPAIESVINNLAENEHLMSCTARRGRKEDGVFVFGVEVEVFRGEFTRD